MRTALDAVVHAVIVGPVVVLARAIDGAAWVGETALGVADLIAPDRRRKRRRSRRMRVVCAR